VNGANAAWATLHRPHAAVQAETVAHLTWPRPAQRRLLEAHWFGAKKLARVPLNVKELRMAVENAPAGERLSSRKDRRCTYELTSEALGFPPAEFRAPHEVRPSLTCSLPRFPGHSHRSRPPRYKPTLKEAIVLPPYLGPGGASHGLAYATSLEHALPVLVDLAHTWP